MRLKTIFSIVVVAVSLFGASGRAMALQIECAQLMDDREASHPDGSQALRNANDQLAIAAAKYEDALREFIAFTDPHPRAG